MSSGSFFFPLPLSLNQVFTGFTIATPCRRLEQEDGRDLECFILTVFGGEEEESGLIGEQPASWGGDKTGLAFGS